MQVILQKVKLAVIGIQRSDYEHHLTRFYNNLFKNYFVAILGCVNDEHRGALLSRGKGQSGRKVI